MLEIGELQAVGDATADHRHRGVLILGVDRVDEGISVEAGVFPAERIVGFALHVVGGVGHALDRANQLYFGVADMLVIKLEPVGHTGIGVGPAEFQLPPGPVDGQAQRVGAELDQPGDLPRDAVVAVIIERVVQTGSDSGIALGERRFGDVDPDLVAAQLYGINPRAVAAVQIASIGQIELPVVPVAGQDTARGQATLGQRVALVRAPPAALFPCSAEWLTAV